MERLAALHLIFVSVFILNFVYVYRWVASLGGASVRPNARGKPHRSAKHVGYQQAELVGVGLTNLLGWWQMFGLASPMA